MYKVDVLVFTGNTIDNQVYTTVQFPCIVNTSSNNHLVIIGGMYKISFMISTESLLLNAYVHYYAFLSGTLLGMASLLLVLTIGILIGILTIYKKRENL